MPELPEVETTRRGIAPFIIDQKLIKVIVRNRQLRWPVPRGLNRLLVGHVITTVERRAKYLLLRLDDGCLIMHLGMSGSIRITRQDAPPEKHDHVDLIFESGSVLRFRDPRKFGSILWTTGDPFSHELLSHLGPEPLSAAFNGKYLYEKTRGRKQSIKTFMMDSRMVAGIGNIYANEALYLAGILPRRQAGRLSLERCKKLVDAVKQVLKKAIKAGGTTLRDFSSGEGQPGYFYLKLKVYDRMGEPCGRCGGPVKHAVIGQRSTYYCTQCQK